MSKRPIEQKQALRMIRTARKESARRVIPYSGLDGLRGTPAYYAKTQQAASRVAQMRNVLFVMFLAGLRPKPLKVVKL